MVTSLFDLSVLHDNDFVSIANSAQSVGNHNNRLLSTADKQVESLLHLVLTLRVQGRRGFVEKQQLGLADQGTGDSDTLFLTAR